MSSVTIVVPTCNESGNVAELVRRLGQLTFSGGIDEVIFVDDSSDGTPAVITEVSAGSPMPVRMMHREPADRVGGLSGAVVAGLAAADSPWVLVMDGDLQHPPEDVPRLMAAAFDGDADTVVASRYCAGGESAGLSSSARRLVSTASTRLASLLFPWRLRRCTDSMTGFFAVRREAVDVETLRPRGFKILLEILVRNPLRVVEVPFIFGERVSGESKASLRQGVRFVVQLATLRWEMWWATKRAREILTFGVVGVANLVLDVGMFNLLVLEFGREAIAAKFVSTSVATVASYFMNRHWTWRHRARSRVHRELAVFTLLSLVALAVAEGCLWVSHSLGYSSTLADNIAANGVGLAIGMVWRFWSFRKWVFTAPDEPAETAAAAPAQQRVLVEVD